ncbi:unnamed protein product [Mytilus edulis]|uniref:Uncharacterized protein n=1 Tax=Mytilus edulis TaxID=6550 RepID=A0A8S3QWG6_MYTED|nr:unnamed protein product [Mytilus edulis]
MLSFFIIVLLTTQSNIATSISAEESVTTIHIQEQFDVTTQSNIAKACSSEESVTKGHREKETEGFSKTELLILFCGALSGIIGLLGFLGILKCVRKRMRMSTSNHEEKPSEEEVHSSEEQEMQEAFALHEGFYETIDDSHLDSISVLQTCNPNPGNDDESLDSVSSTNYIDDRSSYLDPVSSPPITRKSSWLNEEQSQETFSSTRISSCIQNQTSCNPYLKKTVNRQFLKFQQIVTMINQTTYNLCAVLYQIIQVVTQRNTAIREYYCCSNYEKINSECITTVIAECYPFTFTFPECNSGFISRKGNSCEPCAVNYFGNDCSRKCMCKQLQRCDNVVGCVDRETTSTFLVTTQSKIATSISVKESVTTIHVEEQFDGLSKTEVLILLCGALSGIIILLGILGISNCIKKRMCISEPKHKSNIEEEVDEAEENATQETF